MNVVLNGIQTNAAVMVGGDVAVVGPIKNIVHRPTSTIADTQAFIATIRKERLDTLAELRDIEAAALRAEGREDEILDAPDACIP